MPKKWQKTYTLSVGSANHDDVQDLLEDCGLDFQYLNKDQPHQVLQRYSTNVMGRFFCNNQSCGSRGWPSKRIAIVIRMYTNMRYNTQVYFQRCEKCSAMGWPKVDDSYADRVAYRLEKWSGIEVTPPPYEGKETNRPHQTHLCEGCKAGICKQAL